jgi:hypothetical protein
MVYFHFSCKYTIQKDNLFEENTKIRTSFHHILTSFRLGKGVIGNDFGDGVLVEKAVDSPLLGKGQTRQTS